MSSFSVEIRLRTLVRLSKLPAYVMTSKKPQTWIYKGNLLSKCLLRHQGKSIFSVFYISLDTKLAIINLLDNRSLAYLSETCSYFASLSRSIRNYRQAYVTTLQKPMPTPPPFLNFRAGVAIGSCFYMPFMGTSPYCYVFDLKACEWTYRKLNTDGSHEFHAQVTSASAVGRKIYLVGGRLLKSYTLSNCLLEIDTDTFNVRVITDSKGTPPRPRHEHSVDTIANRYLVVFGGLCYNSVGENDVFVYDTLKNTWFVPHISGQFPHLRFGHSSAVVGKDLYIHAGAQIDSDSSYIIYDDLYKLDCKNWVWYKYEHPEVERYLRSQPQRDVPLQRDYWISTTGDSPYDRFQAYMCALGGKLVILGGHSIRMDEDDNEILCNYPLDELTVFNTRRQHWSTSHAQVLSKEDEDYMTVSNMCAAILPIDHQGFRVYIFAGKKYYEAGKKRPSVIHLHGRSSSSGSSNSLVDTCCDVYTQSGSLKSIMEHDSNQECTSDCTEHHTTVHETEEGEFRTPDNSTHSESVKDAFRISDTDIQKDAANISQLDGNSQLESYSREKRRSSKVSNSSISSNGSYEDMSRVRKQNRVTPCIVVYDLLE